MGPIGMSELVILAMVLVGIPFAAWIGWRTIKGFVRGLNSKGK